MSASTSADVTLITGTNAGAQVPYVSEWVQGSTTATYTLIGQVLDSGETNFVGYNSGDAYYLLTSSAPGAERTTLGDGQGYFVTSGDSPSGYLATEGGDSPSQTPSDGGSATMSGQTITTSETTATTSTESSTASKSMSQTASESSMETDQPGAGSRISVFSVGIGMAVFTALAFGVMV